MSALCSTILTSVLGGLFFFLDIARDNLEALYCVWTHLVSRYRVVLLHASISCQLPVPKYRQPIANALNIHANLNMRYNARHDGHNRAHYTHLSTTFPLWFHPLEPVWTFIYIYIYNTATSKYNTDTSTYPIDDKDTPIHSHASSSKIFSPDIAKESWFFVVFLSS